MLTPGPTKLVPTVGKLLPLHSEGVTTWFHESWMYRKKNRVVSVKLWSTRTSSSRQLVGSVRAPVNRDCAPASVVGAGTMAMMATAFGSTATALLGYAIPVPAVRLRVPGIAGQSG